MGRSVLAWLLPALVAGAVPAAAQQKQASPVEQVSPPPGNAGPVQKYDRATPATTTTLSLQPPQPLPVVAGQPVILPFKMLRIGPGIADALPWRPSLRLMIDGSEVPASTTFRDSGPGGADQGGGGSLAFTVPRRSLAPTFLGIYIGGTHLLVVADQNSSAADAMMIEAVEPAQFWALVALAAMLAAAGGALVLRTVLRRGRSPKTYPEGLKRVEHAAAPALGPAAPQRVTVPDGLAAALADGDAVLVTGPFLSAHAGIPVGTELLKRLLARLGDAVPAALAGADLAKLTDRAGSIDLAMETLLAAADRPSIVAALADIQRTTPGNAAVLQTLLALPWRGVMPLTSDGLVERALAGRRGWTILSLDRRQDISAALRDTGMHYAVLPFGSVAQPSSLSLTLEELRRRLSQAPETQRALALMLQTHSFCFIGVPAELLVSLLPLLSPDQASSVQRHYALVPGDGTEVWAAACSRFGVRVVRYDNYAHGGFDDFVEPLATVLRNRGVHDVSPSKRLESLQVARLKLTNIGLFESLEVFFNTVPATDPASPPPELPWTVIFGPNGCGKSTVLRAIATVLAGKRGEFAASRMLRAGQDRGAIELEMKGGSEPVVMQTLVFRDQSRVSVSCTTTSPVEAGVSLVLGFPSLRGAPSPNPDGVHAQATPSSEVEDLLPLADGAVDYRMAGFKQFLVNTLVDANNPRNTRARAIKALLDEMVRQIIPGNILSLVPITGTPYEIKVNTPGGEVPFDEISQGMASVFNWIGVLLQRLYDVYPAEADPKPEARHAVLIVDEIDAHLHPDWQRRLVGLTKQHFPRVQVIATAHSPLLAGSLRRHETVVAKHDGENGAVTMATITEDLFGKSSQDILTGPAFRLTSDRNTVVEEKIDQYVKLRGKARLDSTQADRLEALEAEIRPLDFASTGMTPLPFEPPTADEIAALRDMAAKVGQAAAHARAEP